MGWSPHGRHSRRHHLHSTVQGGLLCGLAGTVRMCQVAGCPGCSWPKLLPVQQSKSCIKKFVLPMLNFLDIAKWLAAQAAADMIQHLWHRACLRQTWAKFVITAVDHMNSPCRRRGQSLCTAADAATKPLYSRAPMGRSSGRSPDSNLGFRWLPWASCIQQEVKPVFPAKERVVMWLGAEPCHQGDCSLVC